ncbi:CHAT domain-containing protein [Nocardia noduli]|uniref:CHAT domain-containing protein n=1 Tax=Nocardia noduli TaxID=2815722 RepID=UPI0027E0CF02|nr:CHAT domain-containing protein [Nocardia noduli]
MSVAARRIFCRVGIRHVLGTLWSVREDVTRRLFDALYTPICVGGELDADLAPHALHAQVRQLRADHPAHPRLWAPFVHMGP